MTEDLLEKHKVKSPMTTNEEMEEIYKKKQARGDKKAKGQEYANWASLGMALLGGVTGDANMEHAAQGQLASGLLQKNASDVAEESVEDMKMKRLLAKESLIQKAASGQKPDKMMEYLDDKGVRRYDRESQMGGRRAPLSRRSLADEKDLIQTREGAKNTGGFTKMDGVLVHTDSKTGKVTPVFGSNPKAMDGLSETQQKMMFPRLQHFDTQSKGSLLDKDKLDKAISTRHVGNLGAKLAVMNVVKTIEGRLSDMDRMFYIDDEGLSKILPWLSNKIGPQGRVSPKVLKELDKVLSNYSDLAEKTYNSKRKTHVQQTARNLGIEFDDANHRYGDSPFSKKIKKGNPAEQAMMVPMIFQGVKRNVPMEDVEEALAAGASKL